jgi:hypothetical protein
MVSKLLGFIGGGGGGVQMYRKQTEAKTKTILIIGNDENKMKINYRKF